MKVNSLAKYTDEDLKTMLDMIEELNYTHIFSDELEYFFNYLCEDYYNRDKSGPAQYINDWLKSRKTDILTEQIRRMRL